MAAKVLIVRNDKLGDFVLALPTFQWIKRRMPAADVVALVPEYTREVAELCPAIDHVIIDPGRGRVGGSALALARRLEAERFDAIVALYSTARVGLAAFLARIPYRLAPATKLAQAFFNDRLVQRRSRSEMPEWRYNLELARRFLERQGSSAEPELVRPVLALEHDALAGLRERFCAERKLDAELPLVFVHAGSGGSASNMDPRQYAGLARGLTSARGHSIVLSAGPGEHAAAERLAREIGRPNVVVYASDAGLASFARHLAIADVVIGGSTGPLHLAGALDRPTAAFYPRRRSSTALRWQTLNSPERRLAFSPPEGSREDAMSAIDVQAAAREVSGRYLASVGAGAAFAP